METIETAIDVRRAKEWVETNRAALLNSDVHTIVATYSGEGDSGCLDGYLDVVNSKGEPVNTNLVDDLYPLLEALHEEVAPFGYENNDGGGGEFRIDIETGLITHESYYLTIERSYDTREEY